MPPRQMAAVPLMTASSIVLAEVGHYARFTIAPGSGVVAYNARPTDGDSHSIRIVATDKGGNTDTLNLSISVISRPKVNSGLGNGWLL